MVILNFTPLSYTDYNIVVPSDGNYRLAFNSDEITYGGSGFKMKKTVKSQAIHLHGEDYSVSINIAPSSLLVLKCIVPRKSSDVKSTPAKTSKTKR